MTIEPGTTSSHAEVTVSDRCEHGSFTIQVGSPGVWMLPGIGRIETDADDLWVFHQREEICECWEYDDEGGSDAE